MAKTKLFNTATNRAETVDHDKVDELIASGNYQFSPGSRVNVVTPDGEVGTISASDAADAFASGYKFDTSKMKVERKVMREYGDRNIEAGLAGVARGLSLGLSDPLLVQSGITTSDNLRMLEEANPTISGVGELAGNVAGTFASGPLGLAGQGVSQAGKASAKALASGLKSAGIDASKSLAQKIVASTAPAVAAGAVEGSLIGMGDMVSEHALGRTELTAENVLASAGLGGVIGGSAGLLFKGLEASVPKVLEASKGAAKYIKNRVGSPERAAFDILRAPEAKVAKLAREGVDAPAATGEVMFTANNSQKTKVPFNQQWEDDSTQLANTLQGAYQHADEFAGDAVKIEDIFDRSKYVAKIQKVIDDSSSLSESSSVRDVRRLMKDIQNDGFLPKKPVQIIDEAGISKRVLVPDESVGPFQTTKRVLDKLDEIAKHDKLAEPTKQQSLAQDLRKELREDINLSLERLSRERADIPSEIKTIFQDIRKLNKQAYTRIKLQPFIERRDATEFTDKFLNFSTAWRTAAGGALFGPEGAFAAIAMKLSSMDGVQLAKLRMLSKMEEKSVNVTKKLNNAVDKMIKTTSSPAPKLQMALTKNLTDVSYDINKQKRSDETKEQALKRITDELTRLESFEAKAELIEKRLETLNQVAPETAGELSAKITNGIEFLRSKLPFDPKEGQYMNPAFRNWKPSRLEMSKFERYVTAVEDPMSVVERFGSGIVDREGIETLQAVYPEIYTELQGAVVNKVAELKEPLSYRKRLELKAVLGLTLDPTLDAESISRLQGTFMTQAGPEQAQSGQIAPNVPKGRLEVNNLATDTQEIATSELT